MTRTAALSCALASALAGCAAAPPARLVLLDRYGVGRYVGTVVSNRDALMTASIEINGVFFSGTFNPSDGNAATTFVGTGSDLLHCVLHFDQTSRTGSGECRQAGPHLFDVTLSN